MNKSNRKINALQSQASLLKLWYSASVLLKKDSAYLESIQNYGVQLGDRGSRSFNDLVPEISRSFSTLIRSWRKAREWIQANIETDITESESKAFQRYTLRLLRAINQKKSVELMTPKIMQAVKLDLETYESEMARIEQDYFVSGLRSDRPAAIPDKH